MAKGIIYVMSSCVDGLVKIGKTNIDGFEQRMSNIERDGYHRISVLKREFAIEVDEYDEKEKLLHEIFSKSRVGDSELFSVNINLVKQLMSSLDGKVIYPIEETKKEIFINSTEEIEKTCIQEGEYYINSKNKATGENINGILIVKDSKFTIKKGSTINPVKNITCKGWINKRQNCIIQNNILLEDFECSSPSMAASIVFGNNMNGWDTWKTINGEPISIFRKSEKDEE